MSAAALLKLAQRRAAALRLDHQQVVESGGLGAYDSAPLSLVEYCMHEAAHLIVLGFPPEKFHVWLDNFCPLVRLLCVWGIRIPFRPEFTTSTLRQTRAGLNSGGFERYPFMDIKPTQFTREEGAAGLIPPDGRWAIRKIEGHTWFYNIPSQSWEWGPSVDLDDLSYVFELAMETLKTVTK